MDRRQYEDKFSKPFLAERSTRTSLSAFHPDRTQPRSTKVSNLNELDLQTRKCGRSRPANVIRTGIDSLQRTVEKLEEGTELFVDLVKRQRNILENSQREDNLKPKLDKLENEYQKLRYETNELREAIVKEPHSFHEETQYPTAKGKNLSYYPERYHRTYTSNMPTVGNVFERNTGLFDEPLRNGIVGCENFENAVGKLNFTAQENEELIETACNNEMELINTQNDCLDMSKNILTEQEQLLRQFNNVTDRNGQTSVVWSDGLLPQKEVEIWVNKMKEKTHFQEDATDAMKAAISVLENQMKAKDEELANLRAHCTDTHVISDELRMQREDQNVAMGDFENKVRSLNAQLNELKRQSNELKDKIKDKNSKIKFMYSSLKREYKELSKYADSELSVSSTEETVKRMKALEDYLLLALVIAGYTEIDVPQSIIHQIPSVVQPNTPVELNKQQPSNALNDGNLSQLAGPSKQGERV